MDNYIMKSKRGNYMRSNKNICTFFAFVFILLLMTACGKNEKDAAISNEAPEICGSWAYIHDRETAIAVFNEDGTAQYEGKDYSFEFDNQFIRLKDKDGKITKLRYLSDDEGMYLYSNNTYTFSGEGLPESLVGEWSCAEKNWSYSFTDKGTFLEDD